MIAQRAIAACLGIGLAACSAGPKDLASCSPTCGGPVYVANEIRFITADADGIAPGFNLDGIDSSGDEPGDCHTADLTAPDGTPGIDNQFAAMFALLPAQVYEIVPAAIDNAIREGGLLFTTEFVGLDDFTTPSNIDLVFRYGMDQPLLGTDGRLLPGQTLKLDSEPMLGIGSANVEAGHIFGGPFDLLFRLRFLATPVAFRFQYAHIDITATADGGIAGILGGIVSLDDVLSVVGLLGGDDTELRETLKAILPAFADIKHPETGRCDSISAAIGFSAIPAFIYDDRR